MKRADKRTGGHATAQDISHWSLTVVGLDSVVGTATRYGLNSPVIEFQWEWDFLFPSRLVLGPTHPPVQLVLGFLPGGKVPGCGTDHPPTLSIEVKEGAESYLYSPSGLS